MSLLRTELAIIADDIHGIANTCADIPTAAAKGWQAGSVAVLQRVLHDCKDLLCPDAVSEIEGILKEMDGGFPYGVQDRYNVDVSDLEAAAGVDETFGTDGKPLPHGRCDYCGKPEFSSHHCGQSPIEQLGADLRAIHAEASR